MVKTNGGQEAIFLYKKGTEDKQKMENDKSLGEKLKPFHNIKVI